MAVEDLKDRLREQLQSLAARIQDTSAWNRLAERYNELSPPMQKLSLGASSAVLTLFILLLPWTFYSSSMTELDEFEAKKTEIRDLYRTSRAANALPPAPPMVSDGELRGSVQAVLDGSKPALLPEQKLSVLPFDASKVPDLPAGLTRVGLIVNLGRLNLDQVVSLGARLATLRPTIKMTSMRVQAVQPDPHYFDVSFKLVALNLPQVAPEKPGAKPGFKTPPKVQ